jgi:hypothetical protein
MLTTLFRLKTTSQILTYKLFQTLTKNAKYRNNFVRLPIRYSLLSLLFWPLSTYSLQVQRVTVTSDHTQGHTQTHSVAHLWTSDWPVADTSTSQHTTIRDRELYPRRDSNPQSLQASGRKPTPETTRPPGSAVRYFMKRIILTEITSTHVIALRCCRFPYRRSSENGKACGRRKVNTMLQEH